MKWTDYPEVTIEDIYDGLHLICIYDNDRNDNYTTKEFIVEGWHKNVVSGKEQIMIEMEEKSVRDDEDNKLEGVSMWGLQSINGKGGGDGIDDFSYTIRFVPIEWVQDEDLFALKMGCTL